MLTETLLITVVMVLLLYCLIVADRPTAGAHADERNASAHEVRATQNGFDNPLREMDAVLTPKAEAKAANKLSTREQLNKFEKDLAANDNGNQPA